MKRILYILLLILAATSMGLAQTPNAQTGQTENRQTLTEREREVGAELDATARAYREGHFAEAEQHARHALELDPNNRAAKQYVARTIHAQYKPNDDTPENKQKAREAIEAYQAILMDEPENDEAYKAVAALYGSIGERELQRQWILQYALNTNVPAKRRAEAYVVLASRDWDWSYKITEQPSVKQTVAQPDGRAVIRYITPENRSDYDAAKQCQTRGMEMVENAISLDPENATAWSYKTNLLLEMAKLAEMDGDDQQKADIMRQATEAQRRTIELSRRAEGSNTSGPIGVRTDTGNEPPPSIDSRVISGGVLNGKAISLPKPAYPPVARAAHAAGQVVVQVTIDEAGNVISARAISGHPLLQAAAVQAAREAKFTPTLLEGHPVKVTGTLIYNFIAITR